MTCIVKSLSIDECVIYVKEQVQKVLSERDPSKCWMVFDVDHTLLTDEKYKERYQSRSDIFKFQYYGDHDGIPEMISLYNWCSSLGINMCIITARSSSQMEITKKNLMKVGIQKCDRIHTKTGREDTVKYKSQCRKAIIDEGGIIIANIGDQESDLLISRNGEYGHALHAIKLPSSY